MEDGLRQKADAILRVCVGVCVCGCGRYEAVSQSSERMKHVCVCVCVCVCASGREDALREQLQTMKQVEAGRSR